MSTKKEWQSAKLVDLNFAPGEKFLLRVNGQLVMDSELCLELITLGNSSIAGAEHHHFNLQALVKMLDEEKSTVDSSELDIEFDILLFLNKLRTFYTKVAELDDEEGKNDPNFILKKTKENFDNNETFKSHE